MISPQDVARHLGTKVLRPKTVDGRVYFDAWTTPSGGLVSTHECEHCDGERSRYVRIDDLRGHVCPGCDSSLDEMFKEEGDDDNEQEHLQVSDLCDHALADLRSAPYQRETSAVRTCADVIADAEAQS